MTNDYENHSTSPQVLSERESRIAYYRRLIPYLETHPETRGMLDTLMELETPIEALDFTAFNAMYVAKAALNTDYVKAGKFGACTNCFEPVAVMPDKLVPWPMPEHECAGGGLAAFHQWDRANTAARIKQRPVGARR